jgi:hypothetical protein
MMTRGAVILGPGSSVIGGVKLIDTAGTNAAAISAGGAVKVDGSAEHNQLVEHSGKLPSQYR